MRERERQNSRMTLRFLARVIEEVMVPRTKMRRAEGGLGLRGKKIKSSVWDMLSL